MAKQNRTNTAVNVVGVPIDGAPKDFGGDIPAKPAVDPSRNLGDQPAPCTSRKVCAICGTPFNPPPEAHSRWGLRQEDERCHNPKCGSPSYREVVDSWWQSLDGR